MEWFVTIKKEQWNSFGKLLTRLNLGGTRQDDLYKEKMGFGLSSAIDICSHSGNLPPVDAGSKNESLQQ